MTQDARPYGHALIGGTLAGLVTMASHPTGHRLLADFDRVALVNQGVHALAIAGTIATTIGLVGLRRELASRQALADAAFVSYGFGAIAVMFAAIASGFIQTELVAMMREGGDASRAALEPFGDYTYVFNQAATKVFVVTASVGIALFSVAMLGVARFGQALGVTGIVVGLAAALAVIAGVEMNIHGFGAIVLAHGTWLVWTGIRLRNS